MPESLIPGRGGLTDANLPAERAARPAGSPPLVLLAGHMSTATTWEHQRRSFSCERTIVVPSTHHGLDSLAAMAQTIADDLPEKFDLAGCSMGGYIALELYPLLRDRIRTLTLISTSARGESTQALIRRAEFLRAVQASGLRSAFTTSLDQMIKEPQRIERAFRERIISDAVDLGATVLFNQIKAMIGRKDNRALLRHIDCETLVIAASEDDVVPVEHSEELARGIRRSRLHLVRGTGHCALWERAEEINQVLGQFWRQRAAG